MLRLDLFGYHGIEMEKAIALVNKKDQATLD